jgi:putative ABC transport system permease protein
MKALDQKLRRDLWRMKGVIAAIAGIMAIGVACLVCMGFGYRNLNGAKLDYYTQCRMADFTINVKKVPNSELATIEQLPGVMSVEGRIRQYAVVDLPSSPQPLSGIVLSMPDERRHGINDILLRRGDYFTERRENEVIVNEAFAQAHGLAPGQWIHLLLNNRRQELFIVGTSISSEFVYLLGPGALLPDPRTYGVFYLKHSYAEETFDFNGACNEIVGRVTPETADRIGPLLFEAETRLDPYGVAATTELADQGSNKYLSQEIDGLKAFGVVVPAIFLAVAALVLNILLRRLVDGQRLVIGTLKAIGYSDGAIFLHFLKFGTLIGVFSALIGIALGSYLAIGLTNQYRNVFEFPDLAHHFYWDLAAVAILVSILFAVAGAAWSTRGVLKLHAAEAMRPPAPHEGGRIVLEKIPGLWSHLDSPWRMVLRSMVREPFRAASGVIATAMGAALLISGFMMTDSTFFLIDHQFQRVQRSDLTLSLKAERGWDALDEARHWPGVDRAEPVLDVGGTFTNGSYSYKSAINGILPDGTLLVPRDKDGGRLRIPSTGLVMNRKLAQILHVEIGDEVQFRPATGRRETRSLPIAGISDGYLGLSAYADIDYLSRQVGEQRAMTRIELALDGNPVHTEQLYRQLKQTPGLQTIASRNDMIHNLETQILELLWVFIGILVLFAGSVFFGTILNGSLVSLEQRRRELGTLFVLGYSPWELGGLLLRETIVVTVFGLLLGAPLGYALTILTSFAYDTEIMRLPIVWSNGTVVWTIFFAVLFASLSHAVVQRIVFKTDWIEALQAKE